MSTNVVPEFRLICGDAANTRLERTRHERPSLLGCVGEPLKRRVRCFLIRCRMKEAVAIIAFLFGVVVFDSCMSSAALPPKLNSQVSSNNVATPKRELVQT